MNNICFGSSSYETVIPVNTLVGQTVLTVTATSNDSAINITYSLQTLSDSSTFSIDSDTGNITLTNTPIIASHSLIVQVTNGPAINVLIAIVAAGAPPYCSPMILYHSVAEGQAASVRLNCADPGASLAYSIDAGDVSGNFSIAPSGQLSSTGALNYEADSLYVLSIAVSTTGGGSPVVTMVTVFIVVLPSNEYPPAFIRGTFEFEANESTPVGTNIGRVVADDADEGLDGEVSYSLQPDTGGPFLLDQTSGDLFLAERLDFDVADTYTLTVVATDKAVDPVSRLESTTASVVVRVMRTPAGFPQAVYFTQVAEACEGINEGDEVLQATCSGFSTSLLYSILSGSGGGEFSINQTTGSIQLGSCLDLEAGPEVFHLAIQCSSAGVQVGEAVVLIEVMDVNEFAPSLDSDTIQDRVAENTAPGTPITQVMASDRDRRAVLHYSLEHDMDYCPEELVHIDPRSGEVYVAGFLDYESVNFIECVFVVSDGMDAAPGDLTIMVTNVNDQRPVCSPSFYAVSVLESLEVNSSIFTMSCIDPDSSDLTFAIAPSPPLPFSVTNSGGHQATLVLSSPLDAELQAAYHISVSVTDEDFSTTLEVYVSVTDVNDNPPLFLGSLFACNVSETAEIGTIICVTGASDPDDGLDGTLAYSITGGSGENVFEIDAVTGGLILTGSIDFETTPAYDLVIEVSDSGMTRLTGSSTVDIEVLEGNEFAPTTQALVFATLVENSPAGTVVTTLSCADEDGGSSGEVDLFIREIFSQLEPDSETLLTSSPFLIDTTSGKLCVIGDIDYETTEQYRVTVVCSDHGHPQLQSQSSVIIEVVPENEYQPSFPQPAYTVSTAEGTAVGTGILQVSAADKDRGVDGEVGYVLMAGAPAFLAVDSLLGGLAIVQPINCSDGTDYIIDIEARDKSATPLFSLATLNLHITNCSLGRILPEQAVYLASVPESAPISTHLLTVHCQGSMAPPSLPNPLLYRRLRQSDTPSPFVVDEAGSISVNQTLDYESSPTHSVDVECFDSRNPSSTATITVHISVQPVNEYPPLFAQPDYEVNVPENALVASPVFRLEATDSDGGLDGELVYALQDTSDAFGIDPSSGQVYLKVLLDREQESEYTLTVMARDSPREASAALTTTARLRVHVLDTNDNRPQCGEFLHHVVLTPLTPVGALLGTLHCSDADLGENSKLTYTIEDESLSGRFAIDETSGELVLEGSEVTEAAAIFSIPVMVQDHGSPSLSTFVTFIAEVRDSVITVAPDMPPGNLPVENITELEGERNTAAILLPNVTLATVSIQWCHYSRIVHNTNMMRVVSVLCSFCLQWEERGVVKEAFRMGVVRSVTYYCALRPLDCSLLSGCAEFFG